MDLFNLIMVIIPLYCIADGIMMLVRGNYSEKQLERYDKYTDESIKKSLKPNAIIYISLGVVFSLWNLVDFGYINMPLAVEKALMIVIAIIIVIAIVYNKKTLVEKPGYIGSGKRQRR